MNTKSFKIAKWIESAALLMGWALLFWIVVSAFQYKKDMNLVDLEVSVINGEKDLHLLDKSQLTDFVLMGLPDSIHHLSLKELPLAELRAHTLSHPYVKEVNLYVGKNGKLLLECSPRYPIARVEPARGTAYLIDQNGEVMPLSEDMTIKLPVIRGRVPGMNAEDDEAILRLEALGQLFQTINEIEFLQLLIDQVVVTALGEYILLPVLGSEKIELGDLERIEEKMLDLDEFYHQVIAQVGWNVYETISLKYEGQVVGKRRVSTSP